MPLLGMVFLPPSEVDRRLATSNGTVRRMSLTCHNAGSQYEHLPSREDATEKRRKKREDPIQEEIPKQCGNRAKNGV